MTVAIDRRKVEAALSDPRTTWTDVIAASGWAAKGLQEWVRAEAPELLPRIAARKAADLPAMLRAQMAPLLPLANQVADATALDPRAPIAVNARAIIVAALQRHLGTRLPWGMLRALAHVMVERGCLAPSPAGMRFYKMEIMQNPAKFGLGADETTVLSA